MKHKILLKTMLLLSALIAGSGSAWADPVTLFHETFGNNTGSARNWNDSYSVKSGVSAVYSGITGYTVSNAKQGKNTTGSTQSGLNQSSTDTDAYIIIGPLNVSSYKTLVLTYQWKAGSIKGNYSTSAYYATSAQSADGTWTSVSGTGTGATSFVERSYSLPVAAQVSTLYLKIVWYTSNTQAIIDEVDLSGIVAVDPPTFSLDAGSYSGTQSVELSCVTDGASIYYTTDGTTPTTSSTLYDGTAISVSQTTTIKAIAVKAGMESSVSSATYTITTAPLITLGSSSVAATTAETDGTITVTYSNLTNYDADICWYEADGTTHATYDWIYAEINSSTKNVDYTIEENTSTDSRTAYLTVYALGDEGDAESSLITITQAGVDFVTLPFAFNSGKAEIASTTGLTQEGLGSDYNSATNPTTQLKFDHTGDYFIMKTNAAIQSLIYDIKGNSFSGGTFKVQTSTDGDDYEDLKAYTSFSGNVEPELFTTIASDVRYIKWIYVNKSSGNVGMGNIRVNCEVANVTAAGYATFTSPAAVNFNGDVKAYIAKANGTTGVTFHQVTKVPANTGVLLYKDGGASEQLPLFADDADDVTGNVFVPGTGATVASVVETTKHNYILNNGSSGIGFYQANGRTVAKNRAYIQIDQSAGVKEFISLPGFEDDDATGIRTIDNGQLTNDNEIYNLAGQRVNKAQKGIYIVNGKKVLF